MKNNSEARHRHTFRSAYHCLTSNEDCQEEERKKSLKYRFPLRYQCSPSPGYLGPYMFYVWASKRIFVCKILEKFDFRSLSQQ